MGYIPGEQIRGFFTTRNASGGQVFADALPVMGLLRYPPGGTPADISAASTLASAMAITINGQVRLGMYSYSAVVPATVDPGDIVSVVAMATVGGVLENLIVDTCLIDEYRDYITSTTTATHANPFVSFVDDSLSDTDDLYSKAYLIFLTGNNAGIARTIDTYVPGTQTITVATAFPYTIPSLDRYKIVGRALL